MGDASEGAYARLSIGAQGAPKSHTSVHLMEVGMKILQVDSSVYCMWSQCSCHGRVMKSESLLGTANYRQASYIHFILPLLFATLERKDWVTFFLNNRH